MRLFIASLFLLFLGVWCIAQNQSGDSGLTVVKQKWHSDIHDPMLDRNPNTEDSTFPDPDQTQKRLEDESRRIAGSPVRSRPDPELTPDIRPSQRSTDYVYEVTFRNNGRKDISTVTWEYVFFAPDSEQEVGRRRFESKEPIRAGKTKSLIMHSGVPPTGTIDAAKANSKLPEKYSEKIVIVSVEYADGTKWSADPK